MRSFSRPWRAGIICASLVLAFATALVLPIPSIPDVGRAAVAVEVSGRLPGWAVRRVDPSWEGGYTVVTTCAGKELSFQFIPGHGLRPQDAWLRPSNAYARERLEDLSDHRRYLVWYADPTNPDALPCADELARSGEVPLHGVIHD